jgi:hypothetical protein
VRTGPNSGHDVVLPTRAAAKKIGIPKDVVDGDLPKTLVVVHAEMREDVWGEREPGPYGIVSVTLHVALHALEKSYDSLST